MITSLQQFGVNVGNVMSQLKDENGKQVSQTKAAQMALINYRQLQRILAGEWDPQTTTVLRIAKRWGVDVRDFFV
jgi:hypothetical protein